MVRACSLKDFLLLDKHLTYVDYALSVVLTRYTNSFMFKGLATHKIVDYGMLCNLDHYLGTEVVQYILLPTFNIIILHLCMDNITKRV